MSGAIQLTRRRLLASGGAGAAALLAGRGPAALARKAVVRPQRGIATRPPARLSVAAFDVAATGQGALAELLRAWSTTIATLTAAHADPSLTLTVGFGPSLFDERFGLAGRRPAVLTQLPAFRHDALLAQRSGGDLVVQACAHDPYAAAHAVDLIEAADVGAVRRRWSQAGFRRTTGGGTVRNLMGFRDGTGNIDVRDRRALRRYVWAAEPGWMHMGTYLVLRRIRMRLHAWESQALERQERTIGRRKMSGRRLDPLPRRCHVRLASAEHNSGIRILRRSYSYDDGDDAIGAPDRGLVFVSFQRDPTQFVRLQRALDRDGDALGAYVLSTSSAVFACPPAPRASGVLGEALLRR